MPHFVKLGSKSWTSHAGLARDVLMGQVDGTWEKTCCLVIVGQLEILQTLTCRCRFITAGLLSSVAVRPLVWCVTAMV